MELLSLQSDYCYAKFQACAAELDLVLTCKADVTEEQLKAVDMSARAQVLKTEDGKTITDSKDIVMYLADQSSKSELSGVSVEGKSAVASKIAWCWENLEVPMQVILATTGSITSPELVMSTTDKAMVVAKAKDQLMAVQSELETLLTEQTFVVGERMTIADIVLVCSCSELCNLGLLNGATYPSTFRWFMTISSRPGVKSVLGGLTLSAMAIAMPTPIANANGEKWNRCRIRCKELLAEGLAAVGRIVTVKGWIRTVRSAEKGALLFVEVNDGSGSKGIQLVMDQQCEGQSDVATCGGVGASIAVTGKVLKSPARGQLLEIHCSTAKVLGPVLLNDGTVGAKDYPLAKKKHSLEYLRTNAHLRPRTKFFSSAMRVRHAMAYATHKFFNDHGLLYIHTPLITAADCEGAGEQFCVTTLLGEDGKISEIPKTKDGKVDYEKDFFGKRASLTVSGQLNVETHACALSDVYTFGPTFRAENSHTSRHLSEFWMIEPEISFAELSDDMALAEDYVKYCARYALENCADDLHYFENEYPDGEKGLKARLQNVINNDFARITYTAAVELLQRDCKAKKVKFVEYPVWGMDLGSEHERYMSEKVFKRPTIVINYPKGIKAFYMRLNDDNETVAAMDILVPKIGELIGGSQREERLDVLERRCVESGLTVQDMWWYAALRRYGSVPHAGFGLGFERLIMFVTGIENIRDVIPFPRVPGKVDF